jgi:outer membrane protein assembly factor BamB
LIFAATNGHAEVARLLVARGANVNAVDSFYKARALDMALTNGHVGVVVVLLQSGSDGADIALMTGAQSGDLALVKAALARDIGRDGLQSAMALAGKHPEAAALIKSALDARPAPPAAPPVAVDTSVFPKYVGTYRDAASGLVITVTLDKALLMMQIQGQPPLPLQPKADGTFGVAPVPNFSARFNESGNVAASMTIVQGPVNLTLVRGEPAPPAGAAPAAAAASPSPAAAAVPVKAARTAARNWPSFRGSDASGNGDGQGAVSEWDVATGKNIRWKTPIPGISNASPIVWGDRIFVTTAVSKAGDKTFRTGAYGDVKPVDDLSPHEWRMYCLDLTTGKIVWERLAFAGVPGTKRHTKASQANSTPATDGRRVVATFGSAALLVAWDVNGKELWRADLGTLDSGWFFDPTFQWGHSSSPIIHGDTVIVQADVQKGSYIAAWNLATGKQVWRTPRSDEISTWGTPTIVRGADGREELVSNGTKVRGYDPRTGALLWTLGPNSEVTVGTPVTGHGLVFVTGGYPPVRPIYAIRPGAKGDISLGKDQTSNAAIAWSNSTEGTYIPSPLVYGDHLFTMNNNGVVTAYDARTGKRAFRGRVGTAGAYSASPVAADGRLYVASEDGEIYVVAAADGLAPIAKNDMKEIIMATPAISNGLIIVRTFGHVYGIGGAE